MHTDEEDSDELFELDYRIEREAVRVRLLQLLGNILQALHIFIAILKTCHLLKILSAHPVECQSRATPAKIRHSLLICLHFTVSTNHVLIPG